MLAKIDVKQLMDLYGNINNMKLKVKYKTPIINFPDNQMRIFKINKNIKWVNKLHEILDGYQTYTALPLDEKWSLNHTKTIQRQEIQNKFYETI